MEYGDFFYIGAYRLSCIKEVKFIDYLKWLSQNDFQPLESRLLEIFTKEITLSISNGANHGVRNNSDRTGNSQCIKKLKTLKKLPNRNINAIIEGMIPESFKELNAKVRSDNFYFCLAHAVLSVMQYIFTPEIVNTLEVYSRNPHLDYFVSNYQEILKLLLIDVEDLSSLYGERVTRFYKETKYHSFNR